MAKNQNHLNHFLPLDTQIEVISIKGDKVIKKTMTFGDSLKLKKVKGWTYVNYQLGFSKFKDEKL